MTHGYGARSMQEERGVRQHAKQSAGINQGKPVPEPKSQHLRTPEKQP